jgi:NAD(P)-dependent dehydrogenase (short-subunit alcohol dehydrogenase family)
LNSKICLVTGATSGIGFAAALRLAQAGNLVVLGCRDVQRGREAADEIRERAPGAMLDVLELDLSSLASVRSSAEAFQKKHERLDVLVNNAGVWARERKVTTDGFELTLQVNHIGHFLLTRLLLDLLEKSIPSRIVNVSSGIHYGGQMAWEDLQLEHGFDGRRAYSQSKLANVLFTRELAKRLPKGVTANAVHPGVIATGLWRDMPWPVRAMAKAVMASAETGAEPLVMLAADPKLEGVTGRYFDKLEEARPSDAALDADAATRLWVLSSDWTKLGIDT